MLELRRNFKYNIIETQQRNKVTMHIITIDPMSKTVLVFIH